MNGLIGRAPDEQHILEALGHRIAASKARFVLVLENHKAPFAKKLAANNKASARVIDTGIHEFCSEFEKWQYDNSARLIAILEGTASKTSAVDVLSNLPPAPANPFDKILSGAIASVTGIRATNVKNQVAHVAITGKRSEFTRDRLVENLTEELIYGLFSGKTGSAFKMHMIGDAQTTTLEVQRDLRCRLGTETFFLEETYLKPQRELLDTSVSSLFIFHKLCIQSLDQELTAETIQSIKERVPFDPGLQSAIRQAGGPAALYAKLESEFELLAELTRHFRRFGDCGKNMATNTLNASKDRAIINLGMGHGVIADNPKSFPEQLAIQAAAKGVDASLEIIVAIDSRLRLPNYSFFQQYSMRPSVIVFDLEEQREWPIVEWIQKAPRMYGWSAAQVSKALAKPIL